MKNRPQVRLQYTCEKTSGITHLIHTLMSCLLHRPQRSRFMTASRLTSNTNWSSQVSSGVWVPATIWYQNGFSCRVERGRIQRFVWLCHVSPERDHSGCCQVCCVLAMSGVYGWKPASRVALLSPSIAGLVIERSRVRIPAGAAGEFSSPGSTFWDDSYFGIRFTPVLPQ